MSAAAPLLTTAFAELVSNADFLIGSQRVNAGAITAVRYLPAF